MSAIIHGIDASIQDNANNTDLEAAYIRNYEQGRNSVLYQLLHTAAPPIAPIEEKHIFLVTNKTYCPIILENGRRIAKEG